MRNGKSQVIVRFLSYRTREKVYNAKKILKGDTDKIFITENLTKYRTSIVKTLSELKFTGKIAAYWTIDGRIYAKRNEASRKKLIQSHDDIRDLLNRYGNTDVIPDLSSGTEASERSEVNQADAATNELPDEIIQ